MYTVIIIFKRILVIFSEFFAVFFLISIKENSIFLPWKQIPSNCLVEMDQTYDK